MKKILSLMLILLTLTACSGKTEVTPCLTGIEFNADITYYNENYKGECSVKEDGTLKFTVTEPESISGYTVTLSQNGMTAEFLGLTFVPNENNMPFSGVAGDFYEKYMSAVRGEYKPSKKGDAYIIEGGNNSEAFTLYISPTGLPQKITLPDERFTVYFYNCSVGKNE